MWEVLLYNSQNATQTLIADITAVTNGLKATFRLNDVDDLSFSLDVWGWQEFCEERGLDPYRLLIPYTAEIKLRYNGMFLPAAFEIKKAPKEYNADNATISIDAKSTLSMFSDAIVSARYAGGDSATIARSVINLWQNSSTYANYGVTMGNSYLTGVPTDRTYVNYAVSDALTNLADDQSGGFDFYFDHDKKFYVLQQRGSLYLDKTYTFGGENSNVTAYSDPCDGTTIANSVLLVGQGIGDPLTATATDNTSAANYRLRKRVLMQSSVDSTAWLQNKANTELRNRKDMYDLPKMTLSPEVFDITKQFVGDTLLVSCTVPASPYEGNGRIRTLTLSFDDQLHHTIDVEFLKV